MKLSFWTMGMPAWTNAEFALRAKQAGFDGVDLRCTKPERGRPSNSGNITVETSDQELEEIKQSFAQAGIEIASLLCYNLGGRPDADKLEWDAVEADLVSHARLAERLGCPVIRVKAARPEPGEKWNWDQYLGTLGEVSLSAVKETARVAAIFENHVGQANARQVFRMVESKGDARLGVLFAAEHSVVMQEDPVELVDQHSAVIRQISFAGRKVVEEDLGKRVGRYYHVRYESCRVSDGIVPVARMLDALRCRGYTNYLTLKWEKSRTVGHHLPTGEQELSRFSEYMRSLDIAKVKGR